MTKRKKLVRTKNGRLVAKDPETGKFVKKRG